MTSSTTIATTIVGNDWTFYYTALSAAATPVPEDSTGDHITFRAFDKDGVEIVKTTDDDIVMYTQSGATLGQYAIPIVPADYPVAWLAIPYGDWIEVFLAAERVTAAGVVCETQHGIWRLRGQGIVPAP